MAGELTVAQQDQLEEQLCRLRDELEESLARARDSARPVDLEEPSGRVSRIEATQQQNMAESNQRSAKRRLRMVEVALAALASGDYGACVQCEEPIAYPRLKAAPESRLCIECQSAREQRV